MSGAAELALSVAAGALTTLSPCVFPLLPVIVGGAVQRHRAAPVAMGVGMAVTFTLIGLLVGGLGGALALGTDDVRRAGAWLLVAFGAVMAIAPLERRFSALMSPLASSANAATARLDAHALWGALALGGLLGLVWSPCAGPLLGSALALVATSGGAARGALLLGLFGIGAALPLVGRRVCVARGLRARARLGAGACRVGEGRDGRAARAGGRADPERRRSPGRGLGQRALARCVARADDADLKSMVGR